MNTKIVLEYLLNSLQIYCKISWCECMNCTRNWTKSASPSQRKHSRPPPSLQSDWKSSREELRAHMYTGALLEFSIQIVHVHNHVSNPCVHQQIHEYSYMWGIRPIRSVFRRPCHRPCRNVLQLIQVVRFGRTVVLIVIHCHMIQWDQGMHRARYETAKIRPIYDLFSSLGESIIWRLEEHCLNKRKRGKTELQMPAHISVCLFYSFIRFGFN